MKAVRASIIGLSFFVWIGMSYGRFLWERSVRVYFLDVGQGDATLIIGDDGKKMLVDGGPGSYVLTELGKVLPPWDRKIDIAVLTHMHDDHVYGLFDVLSRYQVRQLVLSRDACGTPLYGELLKEADMQGVEVVEVEGLNAPLNLPFGGVLVHIFSPEWISRGECDGVLNESNSSENNRSIVLAFSYGSFQLVISGDAEKEEEALLLDSLMRSRIHNVEVLKAGHHCSRTASSEPFLLYTSPEVVICSCGKGNSFGHPHQETIDAFEEHGIEYLRTDVEGTIGIVIKNDTWIVKP